MIGSPQSPDGMAGLVLQKRHRPGPGQGSEGSPKTPGPLHFSRSITRPASDLVHPVKLFCLFSLAATHRHHHARSRSSSRRRQLFFLNRLWIEGPVGIDWIWSLEEARNLVTVARLKCLLRWHLLDFDLGTCLLLVRARPVGQSLAPRQRGFWEYHHVPP